jgi:hypothetical protein
MVQAPFCVSPREIDMNKRDTQYMSEVWLPSTIHNRARSRDELDRYMVRINTTQDSGEMSRNAAEALFRYLKVKGKVKE